MTHRELLQKSSINSRRNCAIPAKINNRLLLFSNSKIAFYETWYKKSLPDLSSPLGGQGVNNFSVLHMQYPVAELCQFFIMSNDQEGLMKAVAEIKKQLV